MFENDTISAISTAIGESGIGIVRLSGKDAIKIVDMLFASPKGKSLRHTESHTVSYGFIKDPETDKAVDEVLVTVMKAPMTYTKEDVVEINCHGGYIPLRRVLELSIKQGARLAEPGEFTKRAFLNGRLDLTQAEAVADIIMAKTEAAERLALEQLGGSVGRTINKLKDRLTDVCAHIETYIDFPEEDIEPSTLKEIEAMVKDIYEELSALSKTYEEGRLFRDGLKAAIIGRPNVGKSSLLNALLAKDRAIVTDMPGTTRDVIEEYLNIKGLPVRILDTAGIRAGHNMAEKEGVRRSLQALDEADMVVAVLDGSTPLNHEDMEVLKKLGPAGKKKAIIAVNKADLPGVALHLPEGTRRLLNVSAKTGQGIEELKDSIFKAAVGGNVPAGTACSEKGDNVPSIVLTNLRHKAAIDISIKGLTAALAAINAAEPPEIVAIELRDALQGLAEITGAVTTDDILQRIFNSFCIGK